MNNLNHPLHSFPPTPQEWKLVDELVESIESDLSVDSLETLVFPRECASIDGRDYSRFLDATRLYRGFFRSEKSSLMERWAIERSQMNWLALLKERLRSLHSIHQRAQMEASAFFESLQTTIDILSQRMAPAPAHRNALAAKDQIYQPRRRALEPADLPAFHSLFCTAIDPDSKPFTISGLAAGRAHHFSLICVQDPSVTRDEIVHATDQGQVEISVAAALNDLQKRRGEFSEFVWFLSEEKPDGAWTSGLVWLESKATRKLANDSLRILMENEEKQRPESCIDALFGINLLSTREFFMEAYEEARQGLLFLPRQRREENSVPFKESLWLFINHLVDKVVARLEKAEPVFRAVKPDWNAVNSLRSFKERLKEWE